MTRIFLLLAATGFAAACMSSGSSTEMEPSTSSDAVAAEPTDGLDNETTDSTELGM